MLDHEFKFRSLEICEKVFLLAVVSITRCSIRRSRGQIDIVWEAIGQGMWLGDGEDNIQFTLEVDNEITDSKQMLSAKWQLRRRKLAEHLYYIHCH